MRKLKIGVVTVIGAAVLAVSGTASVGAAPGSEIRQWLQETLVRQMANEARVVRLRGRQEAVVRSTHDVIQDQLSPLKGVVNGNDEKEAVDAARLALHAHAKALHVKTQRTMTKILQILRRQIAETERMRDELR
jgi:hypothetical protein